MNSIRKARILRGYHQYELAANARLSPSLLSQFETDRCNPRQDELVRIAEALGVEVASLTGGEASRG
ncbi:MAG: helix-turn-helix transcriptional regulator [Candidatus Krumholzibacteriota bacterium]|nr:helix-turn-helix transcriptional regulator [Candidatus Krumholzibacteriota bacterium]